MKPTVSKTVHVDKRPSFAGNLVTIFAGRAERTAETTTMRQNLPGKSHVGRILLNDNTSQERLLDMRLSDIHNAQKKTDTFISHQKKTFINRMEHRQNTWVREHSRRAIILNAMASRKRDGTSKNVELRDLEVEEEVVAQEGNSEDAKGNLNSNDKTLDHKEKNTFREISDALPEINSAQKRTRFLQGKGHSSSGTQNYNKLEDQTSLSLPNIQKHNMSEKPSTSTNESHLPSVLITAEADTELVHQEPSPRSAGSRGGKKKKKSRRNHEEFEQSHLTGPSPTFISETLPRIQIRECVRIPAHLSKKSRRRRRKKSTISGDDGDPLEDVRFLRLQHTLAPHLAWEESRDMSSIVSGVVTAKKFISEKVRKIDRTEKEEFDN